MRSPALRALLLLMVLASGASAEELFLNSSPIGAEAVVDGTPVGLTPLLIRDIEPGDHAITLIRPGYFRDESVITVVENAPTVVDISLSPDVFVASFAAQETVVDEASYPRSESQFLLPRGHYAVSGDEDRLHLELVYPYDDLIRALTVAWPISALLSAAAIFEDVFLRDKDFASPTPATIASLTVTGSGFFTWLALRRDRTQYLEDRKIERFTGAITETEAEKLYRDAEDALRAGNLTQALSGYTRIVASTGESDFTPAALYKAARIYVALGDLDLALPGFLLVINRYPVADYYDAALKAASDIYRARGEYRQAVESLRKMVFVSDLFDRDEIVDLIAEIEAEPATTGAGEEGGEQ